MKKFKKYAIFALGLCLMLGICACGKDKEANNTDTENKSSKHTYVVHVTDEDNATIEGVALRLYDSEGNELTWMPISTGIKGSAEFADYEEDGCYVQLASVPNGYALDTDTKYSFDENDSVTIKLEKQLIDTTLEVYEATIGEGRYATIVDAISAANTSKEDITVTLAADVTIRELNIDNLQGKNITIDGNGHTITTQGGNNAISVRQAAGVVEFKNITFLHGNTGTVVTSSASNTINMTDVVIKTTGETNNYCLINLFGAETTVSLNLTRVDVKMNIPSEGKDSYSGFIRTGNNGVEHKKTCYITMTDCNIDTSGATGRAAIMVMPTTTGTITLTNTTLKTKDIYPIRANYQPIELKNVTFKSNTAEYSNNPIQDKAQVKSDKASQAYEPSVVAKIGDTEYFSLASAIMEANASTQDIVISMISNLTVSEVAIKNTAGKNITIDGNGYTITTKGGNNAFKVQQDSGKVEFKNMKIDHGNTGFVMSSTATNEVCFTDVKISAKGEINKYGIFNLYGSGDTSVLNLTRVDVKIVMDEKGSDYYSGIIRTGNATAEDKKTVLINLTDCNFDATEATGRAGIMIMPTTTAYVTLTNTTIKTKDISAIRANNQTILLNNCKLSSESAIYNDKFLIENDANVIKK